MTRMAKGLLVAALVTLLSVVVGVAPAAATSFGLKDLDVTITGADGSPSMQAGSHPFAMTVNLDANTAVVNGVEDPVDAVKDLAVKLPGGFVGDPTAVPRCPNAVFLAEASEASVSEGSAKDCPNDTVVGVTELTLGQGNEPPGTSLLPVYNLVPSPGEVLRLGFIVVAVPVTLEVRLSEAPPYNAVVSITNISQVLRFYASRTTIWGNPANSAHDGERGTCILTKGACPVSTVEQPFLTLPRSCSGPLLTEFEAASWQDPSLRIPYRVETHDNSIPPNPLGLGGCARLGFSPRIAAAPTSRSTESPSGLDFDLDVSDEGLVNPTGVAQSDIKKAEVTLPEGVTINPSQAEGLAVCGETDLARETAGSEFGTGCPAASKIGTVEVETPLLEGQILTGSLFVAKPYENPFDSLIALYMTIKDPQLGISINLPGKVAPDPRTGQLVTTFGEPGHELPQLPFSHFRLHFREGGRSPLVTPPACGTFATKAVFTPWANPGSTFSTDSSFTIDHGVGGGACPSEGTPPFHPGLEAGTLNNAAGTYSPFSVRLSRTDSEQEFTHFSIKLPPGLTGRLAGIPFCGEAEIAAAKARERQPHGGQEEIDHPSCPAASEIGDTLVGVGVGSVLTYVPGKVYLAGPYNGSNLSIVAITAAKAGPFDLGTVVIREGLKVDPETAEVSVDAAGSDPIPHIIEGIPVDARDIRVLVDRPEFTLNPTSCEPTSVASTVLGSGTDFATEADDRPVTVTTRFQAADCASLGFRPRLRLMLRGSTRRTGLPRLKAVVTARPGDANIGRAVVTLPKSEFLEQAHIGNSCTRVQFNSGAGNGAGCPANSVLGHAVARTPLLDEPLEGPVFLRSNGGERKLPDLVAALHSKDIDVDLVGFIKSLHPKGSDVSRIRSIFAAVPDAPVSRFTLEMFGGRKGLLINSANLCEGKHRAISTFVGQNGKRDETRPAVQVKCGKGGRHKKAKGHSRHTRGGARLAGRRHGAR